MKPYNVKITKKQKELIKKLLASIERY